MANESNVEQLFAELRKKLNKMRTEWERSKVTCGIIGQSGPGKTSLIQAITGKDDLEVGVVEITGKPQEISHEDSGVIFVDLPGCGTKKWPKKTYVRRLKLSSYDCFILVTADRITESDIYLFKKVSVTLAKPCFVVRNKFDLAVEASKRANKTSTVEDVSQQVKAYIRENLAPLKVKEVYLTSAWYPGRYDLPLLVSHISKSLSRIKRQRFIAESAVLSQEILAEKRKVAEHQVGIYAGLAAANGINPILGTDIAVDLGLLLKLSRNIVHIYGLVKEQVDHSIDYVGKANLQAFKQRALQITAKYLSKEAILLILKRYGTRVTLKYASKWVPFVGQALSAYLGYQLTYHFGETLIDECEAAAQEMAESIIKKSRP